MVAPPKPPPTGPRRKMRVCYSKQGLLRMVAHRDMSTHLRRMFQRAQLPLSFSEGFSPKPRFHFAPPLPLGAEAHADWLDIELVEPWSGDQFLDAVRPQTLDGLWWEHAHLVPEGGAKLQQLLQYARWSFTPYDEADRGLVEQAVAGSGQDSLVITRRNKKGKVREVDVAKAMHEPEAVDDGWQVTLGASQAAAEGNLGLFDYLRAVLPDLDRHPLTVFRVARLGFLRRDEASGELVEAISEDDEAQG